MALSDFPIILGVYSLQKEIGYGTGGTRNRHENITYWYVRQLDFEKFEVQPLDGNHLPSGHLSSVSMNEFLVNYVPEPAYYQHKQVQKLHDLAHKIEKFKHNFSRKDLDQAESKLVNRFMIFESNVGNYAGNGGQALQESDYGKIANVLDLLLANNESTKFFQKQHFNKFAISLRKEGYYDKSICYYEKSLEITKYDENIYFNMARSYFDKGLNDKCISILKQALNINPGFEEAKKFLHYCQKLCS